MFSGGKFISSGPKGRMSREGLRGTKEKQRGEAGPEAQTLLRSERQACWALGRGAELWTLRPVYGVLFRDPGFACGRGSGGWTQTEALLESLKMPPLASLTNLAWLRQKCSFSWLACMVSWPKHGPNTGPLLPQISAQLPVNNHVSIFLILISDKI